MDDEDLVEVAQAYASRHAVVVRELLGSGIHGVNDRQLKQAACESKPR